MRPEESRASDFLTRENTSRATARSPAARRRIYTSHTWPVSLSSAVKFMSEGNGTPSRRPRKGLLSDAGGEACKRVLLLFPHVLFSPVPHLGRFVVQHSRAGRARPRFHPLRDILRHISSVIVRSLSTSARYSLCVSTYQRYTYSRFIRLRSSNTPSDYAWGHATATALGVFCRSLLPTSSSSVIACPRDINGRT